MLVFLSGAVSEPRYQPRAGDQREGRPVYLRAPGSVSVRPWLRAVGQPEGSVWV